jgi:hypothetical protein
MEWSTVLHLVALLDLYVAPKPRVTEHVRRLLLLEEEGRTIQNAIEDGMKGRKSMKNLYTVWLTFTGLEFKRARPTVNVAIEEGVLQRAMFDLMLGQRVRSFQLNYYTEIHEVRSWVRGFFDAWSKEMGPAPVVDTLWWDDINPSRTPHRRWISTELGEDGGFASIFKSWFHDGEHLQLWLDEFEAKTLLVNNPQEEENRVFSEETAAEVMKWAKVRCSNRGRIRQSI